MIGAIIGDMVGSLYEFDNIKDKRFFFLKKYSLPTDDSIMTIAISKALYDFAGTPIDTQEKEEELYKACEKSMVLYGKKFPDVGMEEDSGCGLRIRLDVHMKVMVMALQ